MCRSAAPVHDRRRMATHDPGSLPQLGSCCDAPVCHAIHGGRRSATREASRRQSWRRRAARRRCTPTMPRSRPPVGEGLHLTRRTDINRSPGKLRHRGGSSTPARARASTYDRERLSSTTESMPAACRSAARTRPAGPAPMIATWVLVGGLGVGRSVPGGRAPDGPDVVVDAGPGGLELWQDLAAEVVHGCPAGVDRGVERSDDRP